MDSQEVEIRKYYRDIRDRLKANSARLDVLSKAILRPEISGLVGNQADFCEWLVVIFDRLEQIELEVNTLKTDDEIVDTLEKIHTWQKTYQPYLDTLKSEHDKIGKAFNQSGT